MTKDMTTGSPARLLFFFSLPLMFGNVFQQLYTVVDTMIVGQTLGVSALAALGAGLLLLGKPLLRLCVASSNLARCRGYFLCGSIGMVGRRSCVNSKLYLGIETSLRLEERNWQIRKASRRQFCKWDSEWLPKLKY